MRGDFFSPSLEGGLPLLVLFRPRRRSSSVIRAVRTAFASRNSAFSARNAALATAIAANVSGGGESSGPG